MEARVGRAGWEPPPRAAGSVSFSGRSVPVAGGAHRRHWGCDPGLGLEAFPTKSHQNPQEGGELEVRATQNVGVIRGLIWGTQGQG